MICKNCGTENSDGTKFCRKCGKSFTIVDFKPYWYSIIPGVITGFIALTVVYFLIGDMNTFSQGMLPVIVMSSCITSILAYNKNIDTSYDFNAAINGAITGLIIGVSVIFYMMTLAGSGAPVLAIFIPGYLFYGLMGGCLGGMTNMLREKHMAYAVIFIIFLVILTGMLGAAFQKTNSANQFECACSNQMANLGLCGALEPCAEKYLNLSKTENRTENLKHSQMLYQKMINETRNALYWNTVMLNNSPAKTATEYGNALKTYLTLKNSFYTEMDSGITSQLNGNNTDAQTQYLKAKELKSQIQNQETTLSNILYKYPGLEERISRYLKWMDQDKNMTEEEAMKQPY